MNFLQTHLKALIGLLTAIAGLSTLLANATFTAMLSKALPPAIASALVNDGSLLAMFAGWLLTWLNPSPTQES